MEDSPLNTLLASLFRAVTPVIVVAVGLCSATKAEASLIAAAPNSLDVTETVTSVGVNTWRYTLSFVNTDSSNLWHFLVYTPFPTFNGTAVGLPGVAPTGLPLDSVFFPYDARNLDAFLTTQTNMFTTSFGFGGIPVGGSATLSFDSHVLHTPPLLFAYEVEGNYAGGGLGPDGSQGMVRAVGNLLAEATPEPATIIAFGAMALGVFGARRRRMKADATA